MLFNSLDFLLFFLPVAWGVFALCRRISRGAAVAWLAIASLAFYSWWSTRYLPLLVASAAINFLLGRFLARDRSGKLLWIAIAGNLALLGWFKAIAASAGTILQSMPGPDALLLPLGISFFTFTQIAYLVDVQKGETKPARFLEYLLFVAWFPHLIAGPVLRHNRIVPQLMAEDTFRVPAIEIARGLALFSLGLAKKVFLADEAGLATGPAFAAAAEGVSLTFVEAWVATLAYGFQIYFDFSAYSDMALGASKLFGIALPVNFDSPYRAASPIEFWRRWHISLSAFLRDYLYIPLGGNRGGRLARARNIMATMLLGGIWHGLGWTFLAWGGVHGVLLVINHAWRDRFGEGRIPKPVAIALTFLAVTLAWVLFRADSIATSASLYASLSGMNGISLPKSMGGAGVFANAAFDGLRAAWTLVILGAIVWLMPNTNQVFGLISPATKWLTWRPNATWAAACGVLLAAGLLRLSRPSPFLYFQF